MSQYINIIKSKSKNGGGLKAWITNSKQKNVLDIIDKYCKDLKEYNLILFQKIWHYINQTTKVQLCECGKFKKFNTINKGYYKTCGNRVCVEKYKLKIFNEKYGVNHPMQTNDVKQKLKNSILKKYGVEYVMQSSKIQDKVKQTNLKRYGVECSLQSKEAQQKIKQKTLDRYGVEYYLQSKEVQQKIKQTNLKRYGVENQFQSKEVQQKIKQTNLKRYGVEHNMQREDVKLKFKNNNLNKFVNKCSIDIHIIDFDYTTRSITYLCDQCNTESKMHYNFYWQRQNICKINPCIHCNSIKTYYGFENSVEQFLIDNNIKNYFKKDRILIKPYEIDFYFSDIKLAIECNGVYWHDELHKPKTYHLDKTNLTYEKGICLIHIWEDDWMLKQEIVKSRILNLLNKTENKIFARKCNVKEITTKESYVFLNQNHLQGYVASSIKIGLFFENELVSLMTYGKLRKLVNSTTNKTDQYEMYRFCSKLNTNVIGGANKLFKYFITQFEPNYIVTYFDRSWGKSKVYQKLGFKFEAFTGTNYWYIINGVKKHRYNFTKHKLIQKGFDKKLREIDPDAKITEVNMMHAQNYFRLFGPGNEKWTWNIE